MALCHPAQSAQRRMRSRNSTGAVWWLRLMQNIWQQICCQSIG